MALSLMSAVAMAAIFVYMVCHAKMRETRRMMWIPAASCVLELMAAGMLSVTRFSVLTVVLVLLRLALITCCTAAMRRDAAMVRSRARRRAILARQLHAALHPLHEVEPKVQPAATPAARVRIAG